MQLDEGAYNYARIQGKKKLATLSLITKGVEYWSILCQYHQIAASAMNTGKESIRIEMHG
jgi:hypothetical protein